jgi:dUTP pyrophosphatase
MLEVPLPVFEQCRPGSAPDVFIPQRAHEGDAGHDVRVYIDQPAWTPAVEELFSRYRIVPEGPAPKLLVNREPVAQLELWEKRLRDAYGVLLLPGQGTTLPLGFKVALPELSPPWAMTMKIVGRSGWAGVDRLCVANAPGIVDCRYREEVMISLENRSPVPQLILNEARVGQALFEVVLSFDPRQRQGRVGAGGRGGHGSTGV